jgi:hypothetical protein
LLGICPGFTISCSFWIDRELQVKSKSHGHLQ